MTLYYHGPCARITHEVFELHSPSFRRFAIRELHHVHVVRPPALVAVVSTPPVTVCSTALAGVSVVAAMTGGPVLDHPWITAVAVPVTAACATVAAIGARLRARPRTLFAIYRGRPICLFSTRERYVFGQVCRGLLRALENLDR